MIQKINHNMILMGMLLVGTALLLIANYCGVGLTYDSHLYIRAAEQIANQGFLSAEGFNTKPPLYPLLIYWFGTEAILTINIVCLLITLTLLYHFGLTLKTALLRLAFWVLCLFSTGLYLVHSFAWTEPPFISILLLAFYLVYRYQKDNKPVLLYAAVALLFWLPFIRFAGLFIVMPTLLVIFIGLPTKAKWIMAIPIGMGMILILLWIAQFEQGFAQRWHALIAPFVSTRYARLTHNITTFLEALNVGVLPVSVYRPIKLLTGSMILIGVFWLAFLRNKEGDIRRHIPFIFLCYYALLHFAFRVEHDSSDPERYLTPLSYLLLLSFLVRLEQTMTNTTNTFKRGIGILLLVILTYNITRTAKNVWFWHQVRCTESIVDTATRVSKV